MKIFTIIVTYNGMKWLRRTLDSLRTSITPTIPVIIDNNSSDETVDFVKQNYPEVIVFQEDTNLGFGQANNIGIKYAMENGADFVMLLNQDASVSPNTIQLLVDASDGLSMLSPMQMNGDGTALDFGFKNDTLLKASNNYFDDLINSNLKAKYEIGEVCAACWLLPRKVIEKIGGFNPLFFHYGEDNNYYNRLVYHGVKSFIVPTAFIFHDREQNCGYGNKNAFFDKRVLRQLLVIATNINLGLSSRISCYFQVLKNCYRIKTPECRYKFGMFTAAFFKIVFLYGKIRNSRANDSKIKSNWL